MAWRKVNSGVSYVQSDTSYQSLDHKYNYEERSKTGMENLSQCQKLDELFNKIDVSEVKRKSKKIVEPGLDLDYTVLLPKQLADTMFHILEDNTEYFAGDLSKVKVFGKWHNIPRKQVAYGDEGLTYRFSGNTVPALPWPSYLIPLRNLLEVVTGCNYNFVLVNRYKDGDDKIGEHKDDEKDLDPAAPIASLSLGQTRQFVLKHEDCKNNRQTAYNKLTVKLDLTHGSLLLMNPPTNTYWYHSLPPRKGILHPRINLTFRKMNINKSFKAVGSK